MAKGTGDSNNTSEWEDVFSGKRLPSPDSQEEQEADSIRQALIWRRAKQSATRITPEQAKAYYQQIRQLENKRKRAPVLTWIKGGLLSGLIFALGFWGYWAIQDADDQPAEPITAYTHSQETPHPAVTKHELGIYPAMVSIPAGEFTMGCKPGWDDALGGCQNTEYPAHTVQVKTFQMSRFEVTVGQFKAFVADTQYQTTAELKQQGCAVADPQALQNFVMGKLNNWRNPGFVQDDNHPVVCLSWQDTEAYIKWINKKTGKTFRLPTEEEWEYAARADTITAFYWGNKANRKFANYSGGNEIDPWLYTAPVGQFTGNKFGLHDMSGNAWEWVKSCWRENYKNLNASKGHRTNCGENENIFTRRGGAWDSLPPNIRSAYRNNGSRFERSYLYGFRLAFDPPL